MSTPVANPDPHRRTSAARHVPRRRWLRAVVVIVIASTGAAAEPQTSKQEEEETPPSLDQLYELGKSLFDQYAPAEIKEEYEFPSKEQWDQFAARLQQGLEQNDLSLLAQYEPEARSALTALRAFPGYEDYADWLEERLEEIEVSRLATRPAPVSPPAPSTSPAPPSEAKPVAPPAPDDAKPATPKSVGPVVPHYQLWLAKLRDRPVPPAAAQLMPELSAAFSAEGVPPQLAWLAEAESTFNPKARSPSGARGLFQFKSATAESLGLDTSFPDERLHPQKSARAAARYLRKLHERFGDWPLALAAYNVGETRVSRALAARSAKTYAEIAPTLPAAGQLYVPKVCALVALRAGVPAQNLPAPSG